MAFRSKNLVLVGLVVIAVLPWLLRRNISSEPKTTSPGALSQSQAEAGAARSPVPSPKSSLPSAGGPAVPAEPEPASSNNWRQALMSEGDSHLLPREKIAPWLEKNRTNAESLLAARQAGGDTEYLRQALAQFPNDPRVLCSAISLKSDPPAVQRERLDRFKAAAPDNALADYLSARDHLKNAQPAEALQELAQATQKTKFQDYTLETAQAAEELYLSAGKSEAEARTLACAGVLLPQLAELKGLGRDMVELQKQYLQAGDFTSARTVTEYGLQLARQLEAGEGSRTMIGQLVGQAVESMFLKQLEASQTYDFLGGTPEQRKAQLDAQRAALRETSTRCWKYLESAPDAELSAYFERWKMFGEAGANAWLSERLPAP